MKQFLNLLAAICLSLTAALAAAASPPPMKYVQRSGRAITVGGKPFPLVGVNRYELAGGPQAKTCQHWGGEAVWWDWAHRLIDDAAAAHLTVIRLWAFQNFAGPSGKDFKHLDKVVAYARQKNVRLLMVLENTWDACTEGGTKDAKWFTEGYKKPYGKYRLSFNDYLEAVVGRYKNEPAVAVWQVINEGKLYEQPAVLAQFIAKAAQKIRAISPHQLISGGGAIQCWQGRQGAVDFKSFAADAAVDLLDAHDYEEDNTPWPACMADALAAAKALNKPLIIGESGIKSTSADPQQRGRLFAAKMKAAAKAGAAGYLIWSINNQDGGYDGYDVKTSSPAGKALGAAAAHWLN